MNDDDPLNVGNVVSSETKTIPGPAVRFMHVAGLSDECLEKLFEAEPDRPSLSLSRLRRGHTESFCSLKSPCRPVVPFASYARPRCGSPEGQKPIRRVRNVESDDDLDRFVMSDIYSGVGKNKLFDASVKDLQNVVTKLRGKLDKSVAKRSRAAEKIEEIITQLQGLHRRGAERQRNNAAILIAIQETQMKIEKHQSALLQQNIQRGASVIEHVMRKNSEFGINRAVDVLAVKASFQKESAKIERLKKRMAAFKARKVALSPVKPGKGDWYFNLLHASTNSGKVIQRFEKMVNKLKYEDVCEIIEHLDQKNEDFMRLEQLMFDLAWQQTAFPFSVAHRMQLPSDSNLFPAAVARTILGKEWAFMPFSALNGSSWPFKEAVDMIFDMLILTNPFEIARVYWNVIHKVAECMQKLYIEGGMKAEDVEIDFDSLFPVLIICVFAFGCDEWLVIAVYAISFNEQTDDPELQFAMTYLEGLVTQILAIDTNALRQRAVEMRRQWADDEVDPLGLK